MLRLFEVATLGAHLRAPALKTSIFSKKIGCYCNAIAKCKNGFTKALSSLFFQGFLFKEVLSGTKKRGFLEGVFFFAKMYACLGGAALSAKCTAGPNAPGYCLFLTLDSAETPFAKTPFSWFLILGGKNPDLARPQLGPFFCPEIRAFTGFWGEISSTVSKVLSDRKVRLKRKNGR